MKTREAKRQPRQSRFLLQGALAGGLIVAAPGVALLLGILLCPILVSYANESTPGRPLTRSMFLMGAAASILPLRNLVEQAATLAAALDLLSDPAYPLTAWIASGAGWLIGEVTYVTARFVTAAGTKRTIAAFERERTELAMEWKTDEGRPAP